MTRKVIIILSGVILLFLIILGFLFFVSRSTPEETDSAFTKKVREIFPFGRPATNPDDLFTGDDTAPNTNTGDGVVTVGEVPRLRKISARPTAGSFLWTEILPLTKEVVHHARFADRSTGHIFDTKWNSLEVVAISNTTLPKMYEAKFISPDVFLARFLDNVDEEIIQTYFVTLRNPQNATSTSSTTPGSNLKIASGSYLEEDIKEISLSPSRNRASYSIYKNDGGSIVVSNPNGTNKRELYSEVLRDWLLDWSGESTVAMTSKPSGYASGVAYNLNTTSGGLTKIIGNITGLTLLPSLKTSGWYLVGRGGGTLSLAIVKKDIKGDEVSVLGQTLPEKCVWSKKEAETVYCAVPSNIPTGVYPDYWYQGRVTFNDSIWKINVRTGQTNTVVIPEREVRETIDVINLTISENDEYLSFINKRDLSLWAYQLAVPIKKGVATSTLATTTPR